VSVSYDSYPHRLFLTDIPHYGIETLEEAKRLPMLFDAYGKMGK